MTIATVEASKESAVKNQPQAASAIKWLVAVGIMIGIGLAIVTLMSGAFEVRAQQAESVRSAERPIRTVVGIYIAICLASVAAFFIAKSIPRTTGRLTLTILGFAVAFRLLQLFSTPVLEIDHYRYMWDGIVTSNGLSPYRFSPEQILQAAAESKGAENTDRRLRKLSELARASDSRKTILSTIHFEEYTTIYPPVSQAVFAAAMSVVPENASVMTHLNAMKIALLLFDLGVVVLLILLCRHLNFHPSIVLAYAWNPLVVKEIANSGHLDSIAVFFFVAALYCFARCVAAWRQSPTDDSHGATSLLLSALCLGIGVGAKIFPVVLFPLLFWTAWSWRGLRAALLFAAVFAVACTASFGPMLWQLRQIESEQQVHATQNEGEAPTQKKEGLSSFLSTWRMNDVLFSVLFENFNPEVKLQSESRPWYVLTSDAFRESAARRVAGWSQNSSPQFLLARLATVFLFALAYLWALRKVSSLKKGSGPDRAESLLEVSFLVVAIFFFLQPTQNPWYWIWALPLVGFAKNRSWLFVSPLLFIYYLRFWFRGLSGEYSFLGFEYSGVGLFDHCLVWLEYLPIWILWVVVRVLSRKQPRQPD